MTFIHLHQSSDVKYKSSYTSLQMLLTQDCLGFPQGSQTCIIYLMEMLPAFSRVTGSRAFGTILRSPAIV